VLKPEEVAPSVPLPFDEREMVQILDAGDDCKDHLGRRGPRTAGVWKAFQRTTRKA
jgi:hypothetical protein